MIPRKKKNIINNLNQQIMLLSNTIELTNEQIKSLPTIPFQIIPSPGLNKFILPISAFIIHEKVAGGEYSGCDGAYWGLQAGNDPLMSSYISAAGILVQEAPYISFAQFPIPYAISDGNIANMVVYQGYQPMDEVSNRALFIKDCTNVTDYTGGHADNKLKVTVYYVIVDL